ncbi:synaptonemal complex protein 1 isoform X2 [Drosophila obscura]|uniref:synaptonemal complex protein 1 isoform X2 n=1 Tax=Drosophila obscura TaxID=7282 RepID=UPI001BB16138|nr:synaptonemal complex protein 1 isoform X2 [Drosophila obscura]
MLGSYKLVSIVPNEDSMPQKLSSDCVQELKSCCQAALDSGFIMFYDHLEYIQLAKDELEARNQKEKLTLKLKDLLHRQVESIVENIEQLSVSCQPVSRQKSPNKHLIRYINELRDHKQDVQEQLSQNVQAHNAKVNRIKADLEVQLLATEAKYQKSLREVKEMLQLCEAQNIKDLKELAEQNDSLVAKDNTIASQRAEMDSLMSRNMELEQLVEESEAMVVQAQEEVESKTKSMVCLEEKLKEERQDVIEQKDQIIDDLNLKVLSLKQFKDLYHKQSKNTRKLEAGNKRLEATIKQSRAEISELHEKLKSAEVQLASSCQREQQLHSHLKQVKSELFRSEQLVVQLQEQLNAIRETDIQRKNDQMCIESSADPQITQMRIQLQAKEEQLSKMQRTLSCMEESVALTNQHNHMLSQLWDGQREKDLLMERQISQPKDCMSVSKPN